MDKEEVFFAFMLAIDVFCLGVVITLRFTDNIAICAAGGTFSCLVVGKLIAKTIF